MFLAHHRSSFVLVPLFALAACRAASAPHAESLPLERAMFLAEPVELRAAGEPIDVVKLRGYAGPAVRDDDGDGKPELYVGSFSGQILRFANIGTARAPEFAKGELVRAAGEELKLSNW